MPSAASGVTKRRGSFFQNAALTTAVTQVKVAMTDLTQNLTSFRTAWTKIDKVLISCAVIAAAIYVFDQSALGLSMIETGASLLPTLPFIPVPYTHLRSHDTVPALVGRLLL